jgi:membrane protease YdiL (CAAX protease family)
MSFQILSPRERVLSTAFCVWMSVILTVGFLPMTQSLFHTLRPWVPETWLFRFEPYFERMLFPLLTLFFVISLPGQKAARQEMPVKELLKTFPLPFFLALIFGFLRDEPTFFAKDMPAVFWFLVAIPVGEELLFRGWLYGIIERLWPRKYFTATNPLPAAVFLTSLAFAIWHMQNYSTYGPGFTLFQVLYTFCTGLWLGFLRWKTGAVAIPILAHAGLNVAASLL